jgi:microcystin-dependent protein
MLVGAGAGAGLTSRAVGASGGEETHTLANAEMPSHSHGGATTGGTSGATSTDHFHTGVTDAADRSMAHVHDMFWGQVAAAFDRQWGGGTFAQLQTVGGGVGWWGGSGMQTNSNPSPDHLHGFTTSWQSQSHNNANHQHSVPALGIFGDGGGGAHNNMPPWCAVALIIKVTGVEVDPGGALVGPPGPVGPTGPLGPTGPQGEQGRPGPASVSDQVELIDVADTTSQTLCDFTGLESQEDIAYEIVVDLLVRGAAVNFWLWLQPNGSNANFAAVVEGRHFIQAGTAFNDTLVTQVAFGFCAGHADWNTGGRLHATTRVSAMVTPNQPVANVGRTSNHEGSYLPIGLSDHHMTWRGGTTWWNGGSMNINSLRLVISTQGGQAIAGNAEGRASLRILR